MPKVPKSKKDPKGPKSAESSRCEVEWNDGICANRAKDHKTGICQEMVKEGWEREYKRGLSDKNSRNYFFCPWYDLNTCETLSPGYLDPDNNNLVCGNGTWEQARKHYQRHRGHRELTNGVKYKKINASNAPSNSSNVSQGGNQQAFGNPSSGHIDPQGNNASGNYHSGGGYYGANQHSGGNKDGGGDSTKHGAKPTPVANKAGTHGSSGVMQARKVSTNVSKHPTPVPTRSRPSAHTRSSNANDKVQVQGVQDSKVGKHLTKTPPKVPKIIRTGSSIDVRLAGMVKRTLSVGT